MCKAVSVQPKSRREISLRQLLRDEYLRNRSHSVMDTPCLLTPTSLRLFTLSLRLRRKEGKK